MQHDYKVYANYSSLCTRRRKYFDLIFAGIEKDFSHINVALPVKKKHHCNLTKKEKLYN